ncbi:hypothetical protein [Pseudogemmobacter bohemicus]|uniref:hypothetical protein n=1 Tax=Pseudogemmobacter bohemicus TaxID=2250708 RepID=UPI000DD31D6E|nr:hypothetical protein [Pseudogemmobacter bohemicus]
MTLFTPLRAALFATSLLTPGLVFAEGERPETVMLGEYEIGTRDNADFGADLTANGEVLLSSGLIFLDGTVEVAGQTVVTGLAGPGGNACDGTPFVVSLKDGKPVADGPVDSCRWFEMTLQPDALIFHTDAFPGTPAEIWTWTPVSGLTEASPEEFTPKAGQGWEDFGSLAGAHPVDALGFAPVYQEMRAGMNPGDWDGLTAILSGLGSGDLVEKGYRGSACTKFVCEQEWAVLWIDQASQKAFAMWKAEADEMPKTWPADPGGWPDWVGEDAAASATGAN